MVPPIFMDIIFYEMERRKRALCSPHQLRLTTDQIPYPGIVGVCAFKNRNGSGIVAGV